MRKPTTAPKPRLSRAERNAQIEAHIEALRKHNAEQVLYPPDPYKKHRYDKPYDVFIVQKHRPSKGTP